MTAVDELSVPMPSGSALPVLELRAPTPGPTVVVTANIHGDETTGIGVVHNLVRILPDLLLRGSVVMYPSLNPAGLTAHSRTLPF